MLSARKSRRWRTQKYRFINAERIVSRTLYTCKRVKRVRVVGKRGTDKACVRRRTKGIKGEGKFPYDLGRITRKSTKGPFRFSRSKVILTRQASWGIVIIRWKVREKKNSTWNPLTEAFVQIRKSSCQNIVTGPQNPTAFMKKDQVVLSQQKIYKIQNDRQEHQSRNEYAFTSKIRVE